MKAVIADEASRFEVLLGRFCDGSLSESDDRELVALLEQDATLARRFVQQARMERLIASTTGEQKSDSEFSTAVLRSLELLQNDGESELFATQVIQMVKARPSHRRGHKPISLRNTQVETSHVPLALALSAAAVLMLAVFVALLWRPSSSQQLGSTQKINVQRIDLKARNDSETPLASSTPPPRAFEKPAPKVATNTPETQPPAAPGAATPPSSSIANVLPSKLPDAQPPLIKRPMAAVTSLSGAKVLLKRPAGEVALAVGESCFSNDLLRVAPADISPGAIESVVQGVEMKLQDGSILWLKLGSSVTFQDENGDCRPMLENGELLARVQPQSAGALIVRTRQGPEIAVLGTVFRVIADVNARRVALRVEEGRVQFSNRGVKRIVSPDEACVAEDGKEPGAIFNFRPRPASVAGVVIDKETGKPLPNAFVNIVPLAERAAKERLPSMKTDAQGQYTFDALPEGLCYLFVRTEDGNSAGLLGRGTVSRIKLTSGVKLTANVVLDKAILIAGRVTEQSGQPLSDFTVRLIPPGGDGRTVDYLLTNIKPLPNEYRAIAFDGPGRYTALLEKQGFIARIRSIKINDIRPDRVTSWPLDVQLVPSAVLKGRILDSLTGAVVKDDVGAKMTDPHAPRTVLTLTAQNGMVQSILAEADGTFTFETNLDTGAYELKAERFGFAPWTKRLNLIASQKSEVNVSLEPAKPAPKVR